MVSNNRLSSIWSLLARNTRYARYVDTKDITAFDRRYTAEGLAFAARRLGILRQHTLASLERGCWGTLAQEARFGRKAGSVLPRFLYGAFSRIFDDTGKLLYDYEVNAIDCVNSLTAIFTKIDGAHTPESETAVVDGFKEVERELRLLPVYFEQNLAHGTLEIPYSPENYENSLEWDPDAKNYNTVRFLQVMEEAAALLREVVGRVNPLDITPNAGSGASACGVPPHERWGRPRLVKKIDRLWHYEDYWACGVEHLKSAPQLWSETLDVPQAKVLLVPKDCRGPRLISCEPRETMWIQQGLMRKLVSVCERHHRTVGEVNFTDQTINWHIARIASLPRASTRFGFMTAGFTLGDTTLAAISNRRARWSRKTVPGCSGLSHDDFVGYATLDLKDASDRVSMQLVKYLFPRKWSEALEACRSEETKLPSGQIVRLHKHAPMGSATCFPVMALCIWSIAKAVIAHADTNYKDRVFVYGDDVIVPQRLAKPITDALEFAGLMVNKHKSFAHGPFRESCGGEFVDGVDVTPIRLRQMPENDDESRFRTIAFVNNFAKKYGCADAEQLRCLVREWYKSIPEKETTCTPCADKDIVNDSAYAGVFNVDSRVPTNVGIKRRWNADLQRSEYRVRMPSALKVKYPKDNWSGLFRSLVKPGEELGLAALPKRCRFKYRWVHWPG